VSGLNADFKSEEGYGHGKQLAISNWQLAKQLTNKSLSRMERG
jgi:hypothetical protein